MPTWLKNLITETNNLTYDIVRILAVIAVAEFLGVELWVTIKSGIFDAVGFGTGIGAVLIATGAALKLKPETGDTNVVNPS